MPLFAMVGLLASVIRLCIQAVIGLVASVIGCFLLWVSSDGFAAFLEGLPFVVLLSRHFFAIWVIRGGQPGLCCTACLCLAAVHTTSHYARHCYTLPGCWVPCTASVCTLACCTRFLGSMHRRRRHNVIPCQVPCTAAVGTLSYRAGSLGSLLCCGGHIVMPCQVAGFHALLLGEHCCNRLLSSVQCCCV